MYAELTPLDTVFFRDGSPFTMGQETWGNSQFPPPPSVVYGALRTRYFAEHPGRLSDAATSEDPTSSARLTSFHLRRGGVPCFPLPRDLVEAPGADDLRGGTPVTRLEQTDLPTGGVGMGPTSAVLSHPGEVDDVRRSFVEFGDLVEYLRGGTGPIASMHLTENDLVHPEPKIGIRINQDSRSADDGFLYRVGLHRLGKDTSFGIGVDGLPLEEAGLLKLGGESKPARYEHLGDDSPVPDPPHDAIASQDAFVLYLATPAIFEHGWIPSWIDPETMKGQESGVSVRLETAAVGKPGAVGGWNMKEGKPKPMDRTVPAGSVYRFSISEGTAAEVIEAFHDRRISDGRAQAGFGHAFVGALPSTRSSLS
ncbi:type III-B CRISPR module-associated protein Cmr3 [Salinibacter sp.]|uniref:type III-B CRISPR module-associated protein Cmr3 n=1 Tax=Salinibacter sp. TaxID=2065818 RepID=UPI0021E92AEA|nr:type III-B CRISPR module-associated protein Cmr3 [Salinibacter sp.]